MVFVHFGQYLRVSFEFIYRSQQNSIFRVWSYIFTTISEEIQECDLHLNAYVLTIQNIFSFKLSYFLPISYIQSKPKKFSNFTMVNISHFLAMTVHARDYLGYENEIVCRETYICAAVIIVPKRPTKPRNSCISLYWTECSKPTWQMPDKKAPPSANISPTSRLFPEKKKTICNKIVSTVPYKISFSL